MFDAASLIVRNAERPSSLIAHNGTPVRRAGSRIGLRLPQLPAFRS